MKKIIPLLLAIALNTLGAAQSDASWLLDAEKYHISAHGEISCQDCHESIIDDQMHPNPDDVDKKRADFFNVDQCLTCHDEILEDLAQGFHGIEKISSEKDYEACLECHDPHYLLRTEKSTPVPFDPSKSIRSQCGICHEDQSSLPEFSSEDEPCMVCHQSLDTDNAERKERIDYLCFYCHGNQGTKAQEATGTVSPVIDENDFFMTPHSKMDCLSCHSRSADFEHKSQQPEDCRPCHTPHGEKNAHDAHTQIACQACHLKEILPVRSPESGAVLWKRLSRVGHTSQLHDMAGSDDDAFCGKCHYKGNDLGAAAMILPAKSILCMPCHSTTLSVGDLPTMGGLIIFLAGITMVASVWFSGSSAKKTSPPPLMSASRSTHKRVNTPSSKRVWLLAKRILFDVFLQRRLYQRSAKRWLIHSLIFFPVVFRCLWGVVSLFISIWFPGGSLPWFMLDKNNPATAFLFDLTGVMIGLGVILALLRGSAQKRNRLPGIPGQDRWALSLLGGIVLVGFILEGIRIAMTGWTTLSWHAMIGFGLSKLFLGMTSLTELYGYVWYIHAILTAVLFAYLPFSRLMHIIMAPLVMSMRLFSGHEVAKR